MTLYSWLLLGALVYFIWGAILFICEVTRPNRPKSDDYVPFMFFALLLIGPPVSLVFGVLNLPRFVGWCCGRIAKSYKEGYKEGLYS